MTAPRFLHRVSGAPARVALFYHRANTFGGSFLSVLDVVQHVDRARFQVLALVPGAGNSASQLEAVGARVFYRQEHPGDKSLRYGAAIASFAWWLRRQRVRLVYVSDYVTWRSAELRAARLVGVPTVVHVRAPIAADHLDPELLSASLVVGNSEATIRSLRSHMDAGRVKVVYNFVDLQRFTTGRDIRNEFFQGSHRVVGFVGVFRPEKGIEYFLEMAAILSQRHPDVRFLAVGGESAVQDVGWLEKMRAHARELGIADVVRFTGSRDDIPDIMASLDVLVVPSLNEGFGRVIIEAGAAGVPVVGADAAAIPEVIDVGVTGFLVPPRDPVSMADTVDRVLTDEPWRRQVRMAAPARVRERFDPDIQIERLMACWEAARPASPK